MNVIDTIIARSSEIMAIAAAHGVSSLKLFGSVLNRTEKSDSNIDFIVIFDKYEWGAHLDVQEDLEALFNRKVTVINLSDIPEAFQTTDPVDIMELEAGKLYTITSKTSLLYYVMLKYYLKFHDPEKLEPILQMENRSGLYTGI